MTLALIFVLSAVFGFVVLPYVKPSTKGLPGKSAPLFALPVIHGGEAGSRLSLSDLKGRPVVLDFWASWCRPCLQQMSIVERVAQRFGGRGVIFVGVNTTDNRQRAEKLCRDRSLGYQAVFDEGDLVGQAYGVEVLPTLVVVDKAGIVANVAARVVNEQELTELIEAVL